MNIEVYRLWQDGKWDTAKVAVAMLEPMTFDVMEARATTVHWLELSRFDGPKPIQVGIYMPNYKGEM